MKNGHEDTSPFLEGFREGFTGILTLFSPSRPAKEPGKDPAPDPEPGHHLDLAHFRQGEPVEEAWREVGKIFQLTMYGELRDEQGEKTEWR